MGRGCRVPVPARCRWPGRRWPWRAGSGRGAAWVASGPCACPEDGHAWPGTQAEAWPPGRLPGFRTEALPGAVALLSSSRAKVAQIPLVRGAVSGGRVTETVMSVTKRRWGDAWSARLEATQRGQTLLRGVVATSDASSRWAAQREVCDRARRSNPASSWYRSGQKPQQHLGSRLGGGRVLARNEPAVGDGEAHPIRRLLLAPTQALPLVLHQEPHDPGELDRVLLAVSEAGQPLALHDRLVLELDPMERAGRVADGGIDPQVTVCRLPCGWWSRCRAQPEARAQCGQPSR